MVNTSVTRVAEGLHERAARKMTRSHLRRRGARCAWCNDWTIHCTNDHLALCAYCSRLRRRSTSATGGA